VFSDLQLATAARAVVRAVGEGRDPIPILRDSLFGKRLVVQHVSLEDSVFKLDDPHDVNRLQEAITALARRCRDAEARLLGDQIGRKDSP
jgi:hypothetical protein